MHERSKRHLEVQNLGISLEIIAIEVVEDAVEMVDLLLVWLRKIYQDARDLIVWANEVNNSIVCIVI